MERPYVGSAVIPVALGGFVAVGVVVALVYLVALRPSKPSTAALEDLVSRASLGQARLISTFDGPDGMTGLVVKGMQETSKEVVAWKPNKADVLVIGRVFGPDGTDYTQQAERRIFGEKTVVDAEPKPQSLETTYWQALQNISFRAIAQFGLDTFHSPLMVFFDPNCTHCHRLRNMVEESRNLIVPHEVEVFWMPVAFDPVAEKKAAALLLKGFAASAEGVEVTDEAIAAVRFNTRLAQAAMPDLYTPMMMWRQASGQVETLVGVPESPEVLQEIVNRITR